MTTWNHGTEAVRQKLSEEEGGTTAFFVAPSNLSIPRVPGTAVFLSRSTTEIPIVLVRHVADIKSLHETVISLTVYFEEVPRVPEAKRAETKHIADGLWHVAVCFGFIETPDHVRPR